MKIVLFAIFILWLVKISKDILFWIYLWQLKEYRRDRMQAHFQLPSARKIFFNKLFFAKLILFLSSVLIFIDFINFAFPILVGGLYSALGLYSVYTIYKRKIREPVFTKKAILLCGISIVPLLIISFFAMYNVPATFFFATIMFLDIALPLFITFIVGALKYPSDFFKLKKIDKAKARRLSFKNLLVIGITGSYGKTSMKEYLAHILSKKLKVVKTPENNNNEIGVANCILAELTPDTDVFIVEMGAYKQGEIKKICAIASPQIGILTGINEQHVSLFGSLENTIRAKYELIESLPKHGLAVFNGENDYTLSLFEKTRPPKRMYSMRTFSVSTKPDVAAEKIESTSVGMKFFVRLGEKKELFETKLLGRHNVLNILGATLVAHGLGMNLEEIKERVKTLKAPSHTLDLKKGINNSTIIDDSYSANPRGVMAALDVLDSMKGRKKILVMYPLIELGENASTIHRRIGVKINKVCDICILASPDFSREIRKNAPNTDVFVMQDPKAIIAKLQKNLKEGDVVLIENRISEEIKTALTNDVPN